MNLMRPDVGESANQQSSDRKYLSTNQMPFDRKYLSDSQLLKNKDIVNHVVIAKNYISKLIYTLDVFGLQGWDAKILHNLWEQMQDFTDFKVSYLKFLISV